MGKIVLVSFIHVAYVCFYQCYPFLECLWIYGASRTCFLLSGHALSAKFVR